jgi:hypothetical protein
MSYRIGNKRYSDIRAITDRMVELESMSKPTYDEALELIKLKKWNNDSLMSIGTGKLPYRHIPNIAYYPFER